MRCISSRTSSWIGSRLAVRIGSIWLRPTTSRMALSATALIVRSCVRAEILHVEEEIARVLDDPEHGEIDVDDVLVAGEHQAFFGNIAHGIGIAAGRGTR